MTTLSRLSKPGTVYLCEPRGSGHPDFVTDLSPFRTNLTSGAFDYESPSPRTALGDEREISVELNLSAAVDGVLVSHGTAVLNGYEISISGGTIFCSEGGLLRVRLDVPGLVGGARCLVVWTKRFNVNTLSGVISELLIYNYAADVYAYSSAAHASLYPSAAGTLTLACGFGGADALDPADFEMVRIGSRFISTTESKEDHIHQSAAPVITGRARAPMGVPRLSEEGTLAGPDYLLTLAATRQADMRDGSALVNVETRAPFRETNAYTPVRFFKKAPDSPVYHMCIRHLYICPTPVKVNHARVRINVSTFNDSSPVPCVIYFRMYSLANLPAGQKNAPPPLKSYRTASASINVLNGSGVVLDLGDLRLAKDERGETVLALAWSFGLDAGGPLEATSKFEINAVTVEPFYRAIEGGEIDDLMS